MLSGFAAAAGTGVQGLSYIDRLIAAGSYRGAARVWQDDGILLLAFGGAGLAVTDELAVVVTDRGPASEADARASTFARRWRDDPTRALKADLTDRAGAVFERRTGRLITFRDPSAGRPALVGTSHRRVLGASSQRILLADPALPRVIDRTWLDAFIAGEPPPPEATGLVAIRRVRPGTFAHADAGAVWTHESWFSFAPIDTPHVDDDAYAALFRELLADATDERLGDASRIAISLSGGLDSTSIAALTRRARPTGDIQAIGVPFPYPEADEQALQTLVAEHLGMPLHWAPLTGMSVFGVGTLTERFERTSEPPLAPNMFFVERIVTEAAALGCDLGLDGVDGDGAVGGNLAFLTDLLATGRLRTLRAEVLAIARITGRPANDVWKSHVFGPAQPRALRRFRGKEPGEPRPGTTGRRFVALEQATLGLPATAPVVESVDETWAHAGIDAAHPFLDHRVVGMAAGLPREQKIRLGRTKVILRNAMVPLLPGQIISRVGKARMGAAFLDGLREGRETMAEGLRAAEEAGIVVMPPSDGVSRWESDPGQAPIAYRIACAGYWFRWLYSST